MGRSDEELGRDVPDGERRGIERRHDGRLRGGPLRKGDRRGGRRRRRERPARAPPDAPTTQTRRRQVVPHVLRVQAPATCVADPECAVTIASPALDLLRLRSGRRGIRPDRNEHGAHVCAADADDLARRFTRQTSGSPRSTKFKALPICPGLSPLFPDNPNPRRPESLSRSTSPDRSRIPRTSNASSPRRPRREAGGKTHPIPSRRSSPVRCRSTACRAHPPRCGMRRAPHRSPLDNSFPSTSARACRAPRKSVHTRRQFQHPSPLSEVQKRQRVAHLPHRVPDVRNRSRVEPELSV